MPDNKLTDKEIVKALEHEIELAKNVGDNIAYTVELSVLTNSLDLINRLQVENERLEIENAELKGYKTTDWLVKGIPQEQLDKERIQAHKAEAYKECIEKVKALFPSDNEPYQYWEIHEGADNLLKELEGEDNSIQVDK